MPLQSDPEFCSADDNENGICDEDEVQDAPTHLRVTMTQMPMLTITRTTLDVCGECGGNGIPQGYGNCDSTMEDQNGNGLCDDDEIQVVPTPLNVI